MEHRRTQPTLMDGYISELGDPKIRTRLARLNAATLGRGRLRRSWRPMTTTRPGVGGRMKGGKSPDYLGRGDR